MVKKITTDELKQLHHLVTLVEGIVIYSSLNMFCKDENLLQFRMKKNKLERLFVVIGTNIPRYISQQQIAIISEIIKIGYEFIPALYESNFIGSAYVKDFLVLKNEIEKINYE